MNFCLLEGYSGIRNFNAIAGSPVVECELKENTEIKAAANHFS